MDAMGIMCWLKCNQNSLSSLFLDELKLVELRISATYKTEREPDKYS